MCFCLSVCYLSFCVQFEQVCTCVWTVHVCASLGVYWRTRPKSLTRLRWHVSLFVTMVIVSGLSRDVHPDDEIRLHQWRGRAETNTEVSRGMSIERGCERGDARVGGWARAPVNGVYQRDRQTYTHTELWLWPNTHMYQEIDHKIWQSWKHRFVFFEGPSPTSVCAVHTHALKHTMIPSACWFCGPVTVSEWGRTNRSHYLRLRVCLESWMWMTLLKWWTALFV